jgi:predicted XRE-type DNA-binding protein
MLSQQELFEHPNYLLRTYQLEIYRQLSLYMQENNLRNKDIADKLKVSTSYVSQVLNGDFNFTLKKLIELGLMIGKVPYFEFIEPKEYLRREKEGTKEVVVKEYFYTVDSRTVNREAITQYLGIPICSGGSLPTSIKVTSHVQPIEE